MRSSKITWRKQFAANIKQKPFVWIVFLLALSPVALGQPHSQSPDLLGIQDAISSGNLSRADRLLVVAITSRPTDAGLLNLRGVVFAQRGEMTEARHDFSQAVELEPGLMPAWQNLARACQSQTDLVKDAVVCAERAWRHVLTALPRDEEAERGIALAMERTGKYEESLQFVSKLSDSPTTITADLMIRCLDLSGLKREKEAALLARKLGNREDFGAGDLAAMPELPPSLTVILARQIDARGQLNLEGLKRLAVAFEAVRQSDDARKTLERVALLEPQNAANLMELARIVEKQGDHEGALGYLGHARELNPNDPQVHFLFGMVTAEMSLPMEARRSFQKALDLDPGNPDYNYAMGSVILTTRDAATATTYLRKYVDTRPNDAKGHYALGIAEFTSGDYGKAGEEMKVAEADAAMQGGARYFLGRMARLEGDLDAAERYQNRAIQDLPKFPGPHTELARVDMLQGKLADAAAELTKALALEPRNFQANEQLLTLYKKRHDERAATQTALLKQLDDERSKREDLMLRGVEIRP